MFYLAYLDQFKLQYNLGEARIQAEETSYYIRRKARHPHSKRTFQNSIKYHLRYFNNYINISIVKAQYRYYKKDSSDYLPSGVRLFTLGKKMIIPGLGQTIYQVNSSTHESHPHPYHRGYRLR